MVVDRGTHRDAEQLTEDQAEQVLRWRADESARPADWRVRARGNIAFPGMAQPRGPLQQAVSEVFDSDRPPFFKEFLELRSDGRSVLIRDHRVRGQAPEPACYEIEIPLAPTPG
jgi:hypothetical protein